ncbi:MAG: alpha/beta hydrolase [Enhydrobacter sp.]|nr:MAG: alpha/beta hydrolase [Enhydrobacter sp.]
MTALPSSTLPAGVRARIVTDTNGLDMHLLEAGHEEPGRPVVLLLHGFPEIAYSWRKVMPALAAAGYRVLAPDQRGYGRTTGWDPDYDGDLASYRFLNLVRDVMCLLKALDVAQVAAVVGHDFGATVAGYAALLRPDIFRSLVLMSAPFAGAPPLAASPRGGDIHAALAALPRPRKHYQWYYSTREANANMWRAPQGVHDFLRAYYHHKSADWKANTPFPLKGWTADELAKMPTYYIMDLAEGMAETVAREMPSRAEIANNKWLPDSELRIYSEEYDRTGFQGGLQWYRIRTSGLFDAELELLSGRTIDQPATFMAGASDWGIHQSPGAIERMANQTCTRMTGVHLIDGAGHWVQQERPDEVNRLLLAFLGAVA